MTPWTTADIPDQSGRTIVVTGANTGLGLATTKALAEKGAYVVMACRNLDKANAARSGLGALTERTEVRHLDLGSLASVRDFAGQLSDWRIDVLVNNAGVMIPPKGTTSDGFETQWGTNVLGHFLLTALLLPRVTERVVWMASGAHMFGRIDLDDPSFERREYKPWAAYGQSKLADLMLAYELQRRLTAKGSPVRSIAAHPGYSATELQTRPGQGWSGPIMKLSNRFPQVSQPADMGALPELYAATAPEAVGGSYIGPDGRFGLTGHPIVVGSSKASHDRDMAKKLWALCEEQTGQRFDV